ncbi:Aliphatic amidase expression-regulating protein [Microbacterium azadirachtae]|uniref:Aliphatic amidase expression-regulating protein n=2 Tax=Microbacterium azadirachtae TaxID=582680 RepID=A0A0F0LF27_9MICO|nr:Aliphatic amidase expression-regulating protein [Microbacterium azadirachtae]
MVHPIPSLRPRRMTRRNRLALGAVLAAGALLLTSCGSSIGGASTQSDAAGPLKVGVIVPATGNISSAGLALKAGFELGVEKINAEGGVNGKPIEYTVEDDSSDPATSTQLAKKYVQTGDVSLLFGTITGDTAAAVASVANSAKIPFATSILGDPAVCSRYAWGFGESTHQLLTPIVPDLLAKYGTRVAIVGSDYNFPRDYAASAEKIVTAAGGTVVAQEFSPLGTTDFESTIGRLKAAAPDLVLSMVVGADAIVFTKQAQAFGLLTPTLGYEGAPLDADYYPAVADQVTGREHAVRWSDGFADDESKAFVAAYRKKTGSQAPIPEVAANAYFAIRFIAAAANDAKATAPAELNTAIAGFRFDSPLGKGTHFAGPANILQATMSTVTIGAGGAYPVTKDHGMVADTETTCG